MMPPHDRTVLEVACGAAQTGVGDSCGEILTSAIPEQRQYLGYQVKNVVALDW